MRNFLEQARGKSEKDRKIIALTISGIVVAVIFTIWASSLLSRLGDVPTEAVVVESVAKEGQGASVVDSIKRKANLLFGDGSPLQDIDIFSKPIEYKQENNVVEKVEKERDLQALLDDFNATNTEPLNDEIEGSESEL